MRHLLLVGLLSAAGAQAQVTAEYFEKEVRPLLVAECGACHGSQAKVKFAGLTLDTPEGLRQAGPAKVLAAVTGKLQQPMPPSGRLPDAKIAVLARWVEAGAPMPVGTAVAASASVFDLEGRKRSHWAWRAPKAAVPPASIDHHVHAKLAAERLQPAPQADKATLLRRLSYDLTGLPPSADELAGFLNDTAANAWEKQVDRLLASPRFGEHWARHWMDWLRFAESHGSEGDPDVPLAWRYRDYLIRAFNADVPYDQLVREHIAGDLLPSPRQNPELKLNESLLAVAHWRMVEHGFQPVDPWEDRIKFTDNQIDVVMKAFQGLTVSCARCHDHKFDAISQRDYYALFGIVGSMRPTQAPVDVSEVRGWHTEALSGIKKQIDVPMFRRTEPVLPAGHRLLWDLGKSTEGWLARGSGLPPAASPQGELLIGATGPPRLYPPGIYSNRLSAKHDAVWQSPRFKVDSDFISVRLAGANYGQAQLIIENYAVPRGGIYNLRARAKSDKLDWYTIPTAFWKGFTAYLEFTTIDTATIFQAESAGKGKTLQPAEDGRSWFGADLVIAHDTKEKPTIPADAPIDLEERAEWKPLLDRYRALENQLPKLTFAPSVLQEPAAPQPLLVRGNPKSPGPAVPVRYIEAIAGPAAVPVDEARLRLADALAANSNPLTARVMVNRLWRAMFGAGLVRSVDNFGKLGDTPSHPELLDELAVRFMEQGWSIKKMLRTMALSEAYRRSSTPSAEAKVKDPANRWLQHRNLRRLEAEAIRDSILLASGELKPDMFGPSIATYYDHDTGKTKGDKPKGPLDGAGRRSVYLEVRRNVTNPMLEVFDVPKVSTARGERDLTNVPAQSLAMLNNPFVLEQAGKWAKRALLTPEPDRVAAMFQTAFQRPPTAEEQQRSRAYLNELKDQHAAAPDRETAVWRDFAHALFNLKEFLYVR
ncbi:MAG: DUF1553 domain-containing protein [Bryobacterales bacterium]|nr:DUF1553 domain-containing protein [Bryobacterales bacterium]